MGKEGNISKTNDAMFCVPLYKYNNFYIIYNFGTNTHANLFLIYSRTVLINLYIARQGLIKLYFIYIYLYISYIILQTMKN